MNAVQHLKFKNLEAIPPEDQRSFIPYGRQWIDEEDIKAVENVLRSDYLTQGPKVREFEEAFAQYVGSRYAVAVCSGTAALHLACLAADLGPGDEILTSPITFAATANSALYVGAKPAFIDIDPETFNLDVKTLETYLEEKTSPNRGRQSSTSGEPYPRAVIPVHFGGLPCDMPAIQSIAQKHGLVVIEDACHALGATYRHQETANGKQRSKGNKWIKVGSCMHSDMTVFSFHPVKHITTGEGGMVTTNSAEFYQRLVLFRNHGIARDVDKFSDELLAMDSENQLSGFDRRMMPSWYYEMQGLGFNYRINDIQCALGISQLKKIDYFIRRRRFIAEQYLKFLDSIPCFSIQIEPEGYKSSYHLYVLCLDAQTKIKRDQVINILKQMGIGTQVHYIPVYQHPFYRQLGYEEQKCSNAENYFKNCFSIPMYPAMSNEDINRVMNALEKVGGML
ncbi:MAG: UDP-4-amino-4,6-dideoxy-N-acetyl-beta-L-altrosamine transaminase [Desulfobacteraceae bacterium]|nr:UDP-4-amino-4,6-dideoxy-N-acetyl-beta-L-altrosamine transaminase [Desulfobacteraceae bacterium]